MSCSTRLFMWPLVKGNVVGVILDHDDAYLLHHCEVRFIFEFQVVPIISRISHCLIARHTPFLATCLYSLQAPPEERLASGRFESIRYPYLSVYHALWFPNCVRQHYYHREQNSVCPPVGNITRTIIDPILPAHGSEGSRNA